MPPFIFLHSNHYFHVKKTLLLLLATMLVSTLAEAQTVVPVGRGSYASYAPLSKSRTDEHGGDQSQYMQYRSLYITERPGQPIPTNDWWTDMIKDSQTYSGHLWSYPQYVQAQSDGVDVVFPDYWIKTIKEKKDEDWHPSSIFYELTNRREGEGTISYAESHDQALVGDKTIVFRLIDADMYWHFKKGDENFMAHRGIALHKMIRLVTASTINGGYLNFMGNEFGHPEWIDFPREGNGWSHKYARRQWNLVDNKELCYHYLGDFDEAMIHLIRGQKKFQKTPVEEIWHNDGDQVLAYSRGELIFVFNWSPDKSFTDYGFMVPAGDYSVVLNTDNPAFGGFVLSDDNVKHFTNFDPLLAPQGKGWLKLYLPARSAVVLRKNPVAKEKQPKSVRKSSAMK